MRLTCPSCTAVYEVPAASLKVGRRARCECCGATWIPLRDDPPADPPPEPSYGAEDSAFAAMEAALPNTGTAMDRLAAHPAPRPSTGLRAAWAASILVLLGAVTAGFVWRAGIVEAWPPSARLFGSPGVATPHGAVDSSHAAAPAAHAPTRQSAGQPSTPQQNTPH
jgi:predicted Zn finger-like uncharacterized protein